jgi:TonB family protein
MKTSEELEGTPDSRKVDDNNSALALVRSGYKLTIIDSSHLPRRLIAELHFLEHELRRVWPELRRNPLNFGAQRARESLVLLKRLFVATNVTAFVIVVVLVGLVLVVERNARSSADLARINEDNEASDVLILPRASVKDPSSGKGVGAGEKGRVGFDGGKGEGSAPEQKRARGGGSGGMLEPLPPQQGKPPQPSVIPAPIPKLPPVNKSNLPVAGIDVDPALGKDLKFPVYGDPRSKSEVPSNGPGNGGGMGTKQGTGIGEGDGPGVGPGIGGNMGDGPREIGGRRPGGGSDNNPDDRDRVLRVKEVEQRARLLSKPEPHYTEEARRNQVTGTVVLRVVFSSLAEVVDIRAVQSLPFGLTEKAIVAARQIRFVPATRGGHPVSVYMQLEYNFNLY